MLGICGSSGFIFKGIFFLNDHLKPRYEKKMKFTKIEMLSPFHRHLIKAWPTIVFFLCQISYPMLIIFGSFVVIVVLNLPANPVPS